MAEDLGPLQIEERQAGRLEDDMMGIIEGPIPELNPILVAYLFKKLRPGKRRQDKELAGCQSFLFCKFDGFFHGLPVFFKKNPVSMVEFILKIG